MTALAESAPAATSTAPAPPARRRRRWHRVAIPFGIVLAAIATTYAMHSVNEPDPGDAAYLSPASDAAIGAGTLAADLRQRGITVVRVEHTSDAIVAGLRGNATVFVPASQLVDRQYRVMLSELPESVRVVLVEPDQSTLDLMTSGVRTAGQRWASRAVAPTATGVPCAIAGMAGGPAAALRTQYAPSAVARDAHSCYQGGLVSVSTEPAELVITGSADPFRNDRIGEHANEAFAVDVLATHPTLIWLDLHSTEPAPLVDPSATPGGIGPSLAPAQTFDPGVGNGQQVPNGGSSAGTGNGTGNGTGGNGGAPGGGSDAQDDTGNPLFHALPPAFWATLVGLLLLGAMLAVWRGRRLGPPVAEPLPVRVRGSETILGRARLYQRSGGMISTIMTLREAYRPRIAAALGLAPTAGPELVAYTLADRHGGIVEDYLPVLADDLPRTDRELAALAIALEALVALAENPRTTEGEESG